MKLARNTPRRHCVLARLPKPRTDTTANHGDNGVVPHQIPTADPAQTRAELENLRPDLVERYDAALPGARAAILRRLQIAIGREPLPGAVYADMDPIELAAKLWPGTAFVAEVANSVANLALAHANRIPGPSRRPATRTASAGSSSWRPTGTRCTPAAAPGPG